MQLSTCIRIFEGQERLLWHCRPSATDRRFFLVCLRYRVTVCTLLHPQYEHPRLRSPEPSKKQLEKGGRLEVGNASSRTTRYWGIKLSKICLNYIVGCYYGGEGPMSVSSRKEIGPKKKGSLVLPPVESVRIAVNSLQACSIRPATQCVRRLGVGRNHTSTHIQVVARKDLFQRGWSFLPLGVKNADDELFVDRARVEIDLGNDRIQRMHRVWVFSSLRPLCRRHTSARIIIAQIALEIVV